MKAVALISGGKDSCHCMLHALAQGHHVVALAHLKPQVAGEMDSMMYQTVASEGVQQIAAAMELPLYIREILGSCKESGKTYHGSAGDEVEDLTLLLEDVKAKHPDVAGVTVGAILSDYQRTRVEHVCGRLGLTVLSYLWQREQKELLHEMVSSGMEAVLVKVAAMGLLPRHLGKTLAEMEQLLTSLESKYGVHPCGEGGEYESFVLDMPLFRKRLVLDKVGVVMHSDDPICPVAYLVIEETHLEDKAAFCSTPEEAHSLLGLDVEEDYYGGDDVSPVEWEVSTASLSVPDCEEDCSTWLPHGEQAHCLVTTRVANDDHESAAERVLTQLHAMLAEHSLDGRAVVHMSLYVPDMASFARVNTVYKTFFDVEPPARLCVQLLTDSTLALDVIVDTRESRQALHVQSLSLWAPANIGPYSQAIKVGPVVHMAGQIGMRPSDLALVPDATQQAALSLRSCARVSACMGSSLEASVFAVCYVESTSSLDAVQAVAKQQYDVMPVLVLSAAALPRAAAVEWYLTLAAASHVEHVFASRTCGNHVLQLCISRFGSMAAAQLSVSVQGESTRGLSAEDLSTWLASTHEAVQAQLGVSLAVSFSRCYVAAAAPCAPMAVEDSVCITSLKLASIFRGQVRNVCGAACVLYTCADTQ